MKKIILCILLFATYIFAQNCQPISDELKSDITDNMWESKHITMLVQNGVVCDNGVFYNVYYPNEIISTACYYENWKSNERTFITYYKGIHYINILKFDEFRMPISDTHIVETSRTCEDLYKQFKKEMR